MSTVANKKGPANLGATGLPQSRTTASTGHSCERCDRPLTGRKMHFCSDACRMRDRRDDERRKRMDLLNTIAAAVEELRIDLGCGDV